MAENKKLSEVAKLLKITSKEMISKMAEYGVELKGLSTVMTEEQISLAFDVFTQLYNTDESEIIKEKAGEAASKEQKTEKKKTERKPARKKEQPKKESGKDADKEPNKAANSRKEQTGDNNDVNNDINKEKNVPEEKMLKPEKKAEEIKKEKNNQNSDKKKQINNENKQNEPKKDKPKKNHSHAKKQGGTKVDLNALKGDSTESISVQTKERKRHVDTRISNVDLEKIESRERIEGLVSEDEHEKERGAKNKNRRKGRQQEQSKVQSKNDKNRRGKKNKQKQPIPKKVITEVEIPETIPVGEFASKIGRTGAEVVKKLFMLGVMATMNQSIDFDTAVLIGDEFGVEVKPEIVVTKEELLFADTDVEDKEEDLVPRPPVVVVMGHVDHGKTSLLDAIRDTNVISTEAGGITQHIGAYSVRLNDRIITFLDTPGHEAFTTMRARGAMVTDVAILVVAADDGIMPQTIEAINHAKAAGVQIVVAINKIDKDGANPAMVKQALTEYGLVPEEWGGDTVVVEVSAKKRINIDGLLEMVLLVADMQELKANPNRSAKGTVIEARVDKGRGPVATVLVQNGTLHVGDIVIAGTAVGHVRAMVNDKGRRVKSAGPSTPVEIQGLSEAPSGGDQLVAVENEKLARDVAEQRRQEQQEDKFNAVTKVSLDNLFSQIDAGKMKELDVIIKADVQGSVEAVKQSLEKLSNDEVRVRAIHGGVGAINESDVMLADASNAIIIGFNVRPDAGAVSFAAQKEVDIRLYRVIYQAIEEMEAAMKGMLEPEYKEKVLGYAEVRQTFKVSSVGTIAGCYVTQGKIMRNAEIRLVRDGIIIHEGKIDSLKRFKDDAKEVAENFECGIGIENFNDIKEGDTIECFIMEEVER